MSAINQNLAKFIFKYKVGNLTSLLDKFVSMSLTARDAENWTKWAPKLNLKNTALRIWLLKRGAKEIWTKICQEDKEFAGKFFRSGLVTVLNMTLKVTSFFKVFSVKNLILQKKSHRRFHESFDACLAVFISSYE